MLLILCILLLLMVFAFTISHSIFEEYDAIFVYLPRAKSIVETGGLQYDYYKQSDLITMSPPAMPIVYAWFKFLCNDAVSFDLGIRVFPLTYILLTALIVYLISKEISQNSNVAAIGAASFLSMPVVLAIVSNYSLYLDSPFTFFLFSAAFIMLKIYRKCENANFWWFMLGLTISLMLLEKEVADVLSLSLLTLVLLPFVPRLSKALRSVLALILSIVFVGAYNFFFIWDIFHFPIHLLSGYIIRQAPVFIIAIVFLLFLYKMLAGASVSKTARAVIIFSIPFVSVFFYWIRNLALSGVPSPLLLYFNERHQAARNLMIEPTGEVLPGAFGGLPASIFDMLRWDILFTSIILGAIFLTPCLVGLLTSIYDFVRKQSDRRSFLLLSFLLMLLVFWSWAFYCSYRGPELRRLYYFAPLFAIFTAKGVKTVADATDNTKSMVQRFIVFDCLALIYLWSFKFKLVSLNVPPVVREPANVEMLIIFAFFFLISFFPSIHSLKPNIKTHGKIRYYIRLLIPFVLMVSLSSSLVPISFNGLCNVQSNVYYVYEGWQNNLYEVISYINQELQDNYTFVTCYALPISYFTSHPVIEMTNSYGIMNLQSLPSSDIEELRNSLIEHNIRYLLFPKPGHSHYEYFENLSRRIPVLNVDVIGKTPYITLLKAFSKFELFKVITQEEAIHTYRYLTFFEDSWVPLNNYTNVMRVNQGVTVGSSMYNFKVIADDDQDLFWFGDKINPKDELTLSLEESVKVHGNNSLRIDVNAKYWVSVKYLYNSSQGWNSFSRLCFYLYGANTSKPISITFHTIETRSWKDYYDISIIDDFVGWKLFTIPLSSFSTRGNPSWSKIDLIEIGFTSRTATYYLDQIRLEGYAIGLEGQIPSITTNSSEIKMVLSIRGLSLQSPVLLELTSHYREETLTQILGVGVNLITVPSELLKEGATLRIYYHQSSTDETLELYYLGITSDA